MPNENKVKYNTPEYNKAYKKGWVTKYIPETDTYQGQDLPEFELIEKDTRVADAVRKGRDEFAQDYIVPAAKAAASFTPLGPVIGLADAGVAFYQGDNIGGAIGAGMEALPYGLGKLGKLAKPGLVKAGEYLTEETALKNTYKYNPFAFKPSPEMGYRMLGKEGFEDALETGVLRAKPAPNQPPSGGISLARNTNRNPNTGKMQGALDRPYFADGFIDERYAADYMAAVNKAENNLVPIPTHKGIAPPQAGSIPLENATIYQKDWLKRYKEVPKPTTLEDLVDLYRIQQKGAKSFAQLAAESKIPQVFNKPEILARKAAEEKYFGQWFTNDKNDLNWYLKDREFTNPEIINLKVPKSKLSQYQQYDKTLSRAPDREFVIPFEDQKIFNVTENSNPTSSFKSEIDWSKWNKEYEYGGWIDKYK